MISATPWRSCRPSDGCSQRCRPSPFDNLNGPIRTAICPLAMNGQLRLFAKKTKKEKKTTAHHLGGIVTDRVKDPHFRR